MKSKILPVIACLVTLLVIAGCATQPTLESCFPPPPASLKLPFDPYRTNLYTVDELMGGCETNFNPKFADNVYQSSVDSQCYQLFHKQSSYHSLPADTKEITARYIELHDHSIEVALDRYLQTNGSRGVVGIMGGHALKRQLFTAKTNTDGTVVQIRSDFMEVALLARRLATNGFTVVTGGGPGAMEAGNLGAWMAGYGEDQLSNAVERLSEGTEPKGSGLWLMKAFAMMTNYGDTILHSNSLSVPTWIYGFEPPNPFATRIAKYFENSGREEHLLAVCTNGIIFVPGSAGTVQEVFQAADEDHYGTYTTNKVPLILFNKSFWNPGIDPTLTNAVMAWPALQQIAAESYPKRGTLAGYVNISDDIDDVVNIICTNTPRKPRP